MVRPMRLALLLALAATGCGVSRQHHPYQLKTGFTAPERVAIAPVGLTTGTEILGEASRALVERELIAYLESKGHVSAAKPDDVAKLWAAAVKKLGGAYSPATGQRRPKVDQAAARAVLKALEAKLLVVPVVVARDAKLDGTKARWDGVTREIAALDWSFKGGTKAISLRIIGWDETGAIVFRSYGGIAFPYEMKGSRFVPRFELKNPPFDDVEHVREGVAVALDPLVARKTE